MAKIKISQFDTDPANNTDIDGINLAEGMAPGLVNNAIRTLMAQLKNQLTGTDDDNRTIGGNLVVDGTSTLTGNSTVGGTLAVTGAVTISGRIADAFPSGTKMLFNQTSAPVGWVKDVTHDNKALRVVTGTAGTGGSVNFTTAFANQSLSGSTGDTTATGTVGDTTLTVAQIPAHTHSIAGSGTTSPVSNDHAHTFSASTSAAGSHSHSVTDPSHAHSLTAWHTAAAPGSGGGGDATQRLSGNGAVGTAGATTGISINDIGDHAHSVSGTTFGINANHFHSYSFSGTSGSIGSSQAHTHGFTGTSHNHTITSSVNLAVEYVDVIICTKS
jgi:hypothetical protein